MPTRYKHPTVNERMSKLRAWSDEHGREPTVSEAVEVLGIPDLSASGYVEAIKRESIKSLTTRDLAAQSGLSVRRVQELTAMGLVPARRTSRGWRYTEESIQTIVTRKTIESVEG